MGQQRGFAEAGGGGEEDERRLHPLLESLDQATTTDELRTQAGNVQLGDKLHIVQALREKGYGWTGAHSAGEGSDGRCHHVLSGSNSATGPWGECALSKGESILFFQESSRLVDAVV